MPVFDGTNFTVLSQQDPGTDQSLPSDGKDHGPGFTGYSGTPGYLGYLRWNQIATPTALAGTAGIDCKVIHGDFWQQIGDSDPYSEWFNHPQYVTNIFGDESRTIGQTVQFYDASKAAVADYPAEDTSGMGNRTVTVFGNDHFIVKPTGSYTEQQWGPVRRDFFSPVTDNYTADFTENMQSDDLFDFHKLANQSSHVLWQNTILGFQLEFCWGLHLEAGNLHAEAKLGHFELKPIHFTLDQLLFKTGGVKAKAIPFEAAVGAEAKVKVIYDALCDLGILTPLR